MKGMLLAVVAGLIFLLQLSFIPALRPFGVVPDLGLALVAVVGLYGTASSALTLALVGGLALDLASGSDFGLYIGLYMIVGLSAGFIHRAGLNGYGPFMGIGLVLGATLLQDIVILGGLARIARSWPLGQITAQLLVEMLINALLVALVQPILRLLLPDEANQVEVSR
jgi:cell shape-determining protein MreD